MAEKELTTSELNIFFDEQGNVVMGGGLHIKLIIPGTPTVAAIQTLVDRVHEYGAKQPEADHWPQETAEPPQDERDTAPTEPPVQSGNRPRGGATEPQCKKILAVCHRLDEDTVEGLLATYTGAEWTRDKEGHSLPNWDFLRSLDKFQASKIIERLERAEA